MAILKSEVVGKPINKLVGINTGGDHPIWSSFTVDAIDFLSSCTLRHSNSYGATYKIDPTSELTIIHTDGTRYPVDSYKKLLNMVITDYTEQTGATMPTNIRDYRVKIYDTSKALRVKLCKALLAYGEPIDPDTELASAATMPYENLRFSSVMDIWCYTDTDGYTTKAISIEDFLALLTASQEHPMPTQPQPGTHWERLNHLANHSPKGEIVTVEKVTSNYVSFSGARDLSSKEFLKRFKPRPDLDTPSSEPTLKRKLAFYKESGEPWTYDEYRAMSSYCGDNPSRNQLDRFSIPNVYKYVYDDDDTHNFMYNWAACAPEFNPEHYTILSYESVFETPTTKPISTKTTKPKSKPVAQPEPIIPTPIKETFMSKIKDSASATVDQNKQALVIASKMEAGRIINKQVLKQLKPHLPFFLQGYASSPFAPFVAANLVAMVANHTGNSKLTRVSDLMLLGAADSGVAAFNLDKIVDDILSNIKLPAGVLDASDDE